MLHTRPCIHMKSCHPNPTLSLVEARLGPNIYSVIYVYISIRPIIVERKKNS